MKTTVIARIRGQALLQSKYVCSKCGAMQLGTPRTVDFESQEQLRSFENVVALSHSMPIGWASFYPIGTYKCPCCIRRPS